MVRFFQHLQTFSALRAVGADVKKNFHFQSEKIHSHGRKTVQYLQNVSALRTLGGDVKVFKTKFLGDDLDEKIEFKETSITCTLICKTKFMGEILTKR